MSLCEIMRDFVMPLCCFGYVLIVGYVLCIISMILYYIKDIAYDLIYFY